MKAVLLDAPGPPSSLRIGELADPAPLPDEVLVRVCKSGDLVLIHGGSGGVGGFAIQLAKQLGTTVSDNVLCRQCRLRA